MGQGVHTVALQVAVEELGVDPARVRVVVDTVAELGAGQTTGSRARSWAPARWPPPAGRRAPTAAGRASTTRASTGSTGPALGSVARPTIHSTFGYAAQLVVIDRESGDIERVVAAHDVGRAVNPLLCEGQVVGSVHMGLGYALTEDFPTDELGRPTAMTLRQLGILRAKDVPPIDVILVERPQPRAPTGSRAWARSGSSPPPARWPRPCTTSTASGGHAPAAPMRTGAA